MVISGIEDIMATPEDGLALAKEIPNSQFVTIPGAHSSPVEQALKVNQLIEQFIFNI